MSLSLFCVPCGKRFANSNVFDAHLTGKKHLKALEKMGKVEEAEVVKFDIEAKKRKMQEGEEQRKLKKKQEEEAMNSRLGGEIESTENDGDDVEQQAAKKPKSDPVAKRNEFIAGKNDEAPVEWWKGTVHATAKAQKDKWEDLRAQNDSSWYCMSYKCTGGNATGHLNPRLATQCQKCGAFKRIGCETVHHNIVDKSKEFAKREFRLGNKF